MDLRQKKSQEKIIQALSDLLEEEAIDAISFSKIAKAASVSRQTLYSNYDNKEAIIEQYIEEWFTGIEQAFEPAILPINKDSEVFIASFLHKLTLQFGHEYKIRRAIISGRAGARPLSKLRAKIASMLSQKLAKTNLSRNNQDIQVTSIYVAFGIIAVTDAWCEGHIDISSKKLADKLAKQILYGINDLQ